jgi:hypothetical protein
MNKRFGRVKVGWLLALGEPEVDLRDKEEMELSIRLT